jgi:hypothetical protein
MTARLPPAICQQRRCITRQVHHTNLTEDAVAPALVPAASYYSTAVRYCGRHAYCCSSSAAVPLCCCAAVLLLTHHTLVWQRQVGFCDTVADCCCNRLLNLRPDALNALNLSAAPTKTKS